MSRSTKSKDSAQIVNSANVNFVDLPLSQQVIQALHEIGYEKPTPIQAEIIPVLCEGHDVIGQAQTGTGKTAAFALPILSKVRISYKDEDCIPQALILAPTRELAIQVADSFRKYSSKIKDLVIATLCGGQDYRTQLKQLKQGSHIVVGTPGRIIDHIERGTLDISKLDILVLDEADEMLRMGFIDDVNLILERSSENKQIALFSATMPSAIKNIAGKYLKDPVKVNIEPKHETSSLISQYYWGVNYSDKIDALLRILEISKHDGMDAMIVFARTKLETITIGEQLLAAGHRAIVLNGDIEQKMRERSIKELKAGRIDILIATDVAARGLDVDRITHVINYDMPHDEETYLHRIGRTGRAGRSGVAISFATRGETSKLRYIERFTKTTIEKYVMPTVAEINEKRIQFFKSRVLNIIKASEEKINKQEKLEAMATVINQIAGESDHSVNKIAAAVAVMAYGDAPLLLSESDNLKSLDMSNSQRSNYGNSSGRDRDSRNGGDRSRRSGGPRGNSFGRSEGGRSDRSGSGRGRSERSESGRSFDKPRAARGERSEGGRSFDKPRAARGERSEGGRSFDKPRAARGERSENGRAFERSGRGRSERSEGGRSFDKPRAARGERSENGRSFERSGKGRSERAEGGRSFDKPRTARGERFESGRSERPSRGRSERSEGRSERPAKFISNDKVRAGKPKSSSKKSNADSKPRDKGRVLKLKPRKKS